MADPGDGGPWGWRTLGMADPVDGGPEPMEGVLTGTHSESWGKVPDFGSSNAENASSRAPNEV